MNYLPIAIALYVPCLYNAVWPGMQALGCGAQDICRRSHFFHSQLVVGIILSQPIPRAFALGYQYIAPTGAKCKIIPWTTVPNIYRRNPCQLLNVRDDP